MKPSIALGPWDAPEIEIGHCDLYPLLGALIQEHAPLPFPLRDSIQSLLCLDGIHLYEETERFFGEFERTCRRVLGGDVTHVDPAWRKDDAFYPYIRNVEDDGTISPGARDAAYRFLALLAAHPELWPLRTSTCDTPRQA